MTTIRMTPPRGAARSLQLLAGLCLGASTVWAQLPAPAREANDALRRRNAKALEPLVEPLRATVRNRSSATTPLLLTWGRTERAVGEVDSALVAFADLEALGDAPGLGYLEQARVLLTGQIPEGEELWYLGAQAAGPAAWAEYRKDLAPLFSDAEAAEFDALPPGQARVDWLLKFWGEREKRDMRNPGERLLEHYRRLDYVQRNFALHPDRERVYLPGAAYKAPNADVDDRGMIYLRHGRPTEISEGGQGGPLGNTERVTGVSEEAPPPNVTWRYASLDGDRFFTFRACATLAPKTGRYTVGNCVPPLDYHLVESLVDVFGPFLARAIASGRAIIRDPGSQDVSSNEIERLIIARANFGRRFTDLLTGDRFTLPVDAQKERAAGIEDIKVGTTTDTYEHRYARPMDARIEALIAGRTGDSGLVHVAYALPASDFKPTRSEDGWLYPVHVKVQARDARDSVIAILNEERAFRSSKTVTRRETLLGRVAVTLPPGTMKVRVVLEHTEERGATAGPFEVAMPAVRAGAFTGGDLILGHERYVLGWARAPGDTVRFNPAGNYPKEGALELYNELYGLEAGDPIRYTLTVTKPKEGLFGKVLGGEAAALTLTGEETATGLVTPVRRFLGIGGFEPGPYTVELLFEVPGKGTVKRSRAFTISEKL